MVMLLRLHVLCTTVVIYALHPQVSAALLQSPPLFSRLAYTNTLAFTRTSTNYNSHIKEQECEYGHAYAHHQNDPQLFKAYPLTKPKSMRWAFEQNLDSRHALTHSLFMEVASHLRSNTAPNGTRAACSPFLMKRDADDDVNVPIIKFTCDDLESALASDYLDACTGRSRNTSNEDGDGDSTNRNDEQQGGWRMEGLGSARIDTMTINSNLNSNEKKNFQEHSFQSKRLHWTSVLDAQNTVVFNSAGAHMSSQLAPTSLAALHGLNGAATGVCLNLYTTKSDIRQSAPPHTDKQDVVVVQTQGRKRWRIYSPPDSALKLNADPFCRGKGEDELSVPMLSDERSELLLDVLLEPGDVLFVPARFPHTTDTLNCYDENHSGGSGSDGNGGDKERERSIHLTLGLDTHVWAMNYMSMRTLVLRRFGIHDALDSNDSNTDHDRNMDKCVGRVNQLSYDLREGLFSSLDNNCNEVLVPEQNRARSRILATNLLAFHERSNHECGWVDTTHNSLTLDQCVETVTHFQTIGQKIKNSHNDMYIAAVEEERRRNVEGGGWALNVGDIMVKERADRLSIFRVPIFFEQLDKLREELRAWGDNQGNRLTPSRGVSSHPTWTPLPTILNGDQVEANILGSSAVDNVSDGIKSSWLSAKIVKVRSDGFFNLQLFDGTVEEGVARHDIKGPHGLGVFL
jgi:hypothetical protein